MGGLDVWLILKIAKAAAPTAVTVAARPPTRVTFRAFVLIPAVSLDSCVVGVGADSVEPWLRTPSFSKTQVIARARPTLLADREPPMVLSFATANRIAAPDAVGESQT